MSLFIYRPACMRKVPGLLIALTGDKRSLTRWTDASTSSPSFNMGHVNEIIVIDAQTKRNKR